MRKLLFLLGIGGGAYALYNYYSKQLEFAMDWDFDIKDMKVIDINSKGAKVDFLVSVLNRSSFEVEVLDYDIDVMYKGLKVANAKSKESFVVEPQNWFDVDVVGNIDFGASLTRLDDLGIQILKGEPFTVDIKGKMNVMFAGFDREVMLNTKDIVVSENITSDLMLGGVTKPINDLLSKLGIKL